MKTVGERIRRVDAKSKADGSLRFTDDLAFEGLCGEIIGSDIAHGRILSIDFDEAFDFSDLVIVDYRDIEGSNVNAMIDKDQPFLAEKTVNFIGEPILLLAHRSKRRLKAAKEHIAITYEPLEPVLSMEEALKKKSLVYGDDNIFHKIETLQGEAPGADLFTLEKTYRTSHQEQLYLEPQSMIARYNGGAIKIVGSMQCPFFVEEALELISGEKIEVEQAPTGGAFGGKEEYPSLVAAYAYLLCKKAKEDVKIVYDRAYDIAYTTKRHPARMRYKSRFDASGKLYSLDVDIMIDGGAYSTLSPVVLSRAVLHAAGFYDCPHIHINAVAVATNTPPNGAFRGFGAPQVIFGIERHMDDIAHRLGISPVAVREINLPDADSISVSGVKIGEHAALRELFERTREESGYDRKYALKDPFKGVGMALFMHGGGYTGTGETSLNSHVLLQLHPEGSVEIKIGSVEMGQGTLTALAQIVSGTLELPMDLVRYHVPNTYEVVDSGPTVASRTVMIVGALLRQAASALKEAVGSYGDENTFRKAVEAYFSKNTTDRFTAVYKKPDNIKWDEAHFFGNGYDAYSLGCYVAEVEVDPVDYSVRVTDFYAYSDIGEVVNPMMAEGQVEGGVAQGIGYALYERLVYEDGKIKNSTLSDYMLPMAADMSGIRVAFVHTGDAAKGLGELPMDGPAAAVVNAVTHALGAEFDTLPVTPEVIMEKLCR